MHTYTYRHRYRHRHLTQTQIQTHIPFAVCQQMTSMSTVATPWSRKRQSIVASDTWRSHWLNRLSNSARESCRPTLASLSSFSSYVPLRICIWRYGFWSPHARAVGLRWRPWALSAPMCHYAYVCDVMAFQRRARELSAYVGVIELLPIMCMYVTL